MRVLFPMPVFLVPLLLAGGTLSSQTTSYPWLEKYDSSESIARRIPTPAGFTRTREAAKSFESWLRYLPLRKGLPPVLLYDGGKKANQGAHWAVLDVDVGEKDLQQCADAVIRLRAEYLYSAGSLADIHFDFTSGDRADFTKWAQGYRPVVEGNKVTWVKSAAADSSYRTFRRYLDTVFAYAGTVSPARELKPVDDVRRMKIGDVFIKGGTPGHAVLVVDMAEDAGTGRKVFLLAQSFMPAQDMHVLRNPDSRTRSPWYGLDFGEALHTPEWTFQRDELKRF